MSPERELDLLVAEPAEGEVIRFKVEFPGSPTTYTYTGIRIKGQWYLSGNETTGRSWPNLIRWLKNKNADVLTIDLATSWENL